MKNELDKAFDKAEDILDEIKNGTSKVDTCREFDSEFIRNTVIALMVAGEKAQGRQ